MTMNFLENVRYYAGKLFDPLEHLPGILLSFWLGIINLFAPLWYPFLVVLVLIGIDLYWGIRSSLFQGKFVKSEVIRRTVDKITSYFSCLAAAYMIEHILFSDSILITSVIASLASACELWSFSASILIIHPDFPFIRLFRKHLIGEIESKMGVTLSELSKNAACEENMPKSKLNHNNDICDAGDPCSHN